jgi:16S rRNA A1518/A1519 N6-dimethyltransferase RsmA/KsgA/DIM1 with predicted DNA glycosylase/AP lyase activity
VSEGDTRRILLPEEPFRVVANLPVNATTDLLHLFFDDPATPLTASPTCSSSGR